MKKRAWPWLRVSWCAVLACLVNFVISPTAVAEESAGFEVKAQASREEVVIAEQFAITIRATCPQGWHVRPMPLSGELNDFRVIESNEKSEHVGERVVWTARLLLEAYAPGQKIIAPIEIAFEPPPDRETQSDQTPAKTLATEPVVIRVHSALKPFASRHELRPIYDAVTVPWTWRQWSISVACLAAVVGCGMLCVRWVNRFHDEDGRLSRRSLLVQLDRLREAWLRGSASHPEAVEGASEIARRWLRWRDGTPFTHRTTDGWAGRAQRWDDPVVDVLRLADRVKFASAEPTLDEVRCSLEQVRLAICADGSRP